MVAAQSWASTRSGETDKIHFFELGLRWLRLKTYHWRGLYEIPTYRSCAKINCTLTISFEFMQGQDQAFLWAVFSPWLDRVPVESPLQLRKVFCNLCFNFNWLQVVCNHLPGDRLPHHWAQHVLLEVRIMLGNFLVFLMTKWTLVDNSVRFLVDAPQGLWCGSPQITSWTQYASFSSYFGEL